MIPALQATRVIVSRRSTLSCYSFGGTLLCTVDLNKAVAMKATRVAIRKGQRPMTTGTATPKRFVESMSFLQYLLRCNLISNYDRKN